MDKVKAIENVSIWPLGEPHCVILQVLLNTHSEKILILFDVFDFPSVPHLGVTSSSVVDAPKTSSVYVSVTPSSRLYLTQGSARDVM